MSLEKFQKTFCFDTRKASLRVCRDEKKRFCLDVVSDEKTRELIIRDDDRNEFADYLETLAAKVRKNKL